MISLNDLTTVIQQYLIRQANSIEIPEVTRTMDLSDDLVGCIIGRGGSKINSIRRESGAQIKIANAEEGSSFRRITIRGSPDSVRAAVGMIEYTVTLHRQIVEMNMMMDAYERGAKTTTPTAMTSPIINDQSNQ